MSCAVCERRKPRRDCPALGKGICDACCGRYRELTLDCPAECPHLIDAYRYERQRPVPESRKFRPDFPLSARQVDEIQQLLTTLLEGLQAFRQRHRELADADLAEAMESRLKALETQASGLVYDASPVGGLGRELYQQLAELEQKPGQRSELAPATVPTREQRILAYVLLIRTVKINSSGRARARGFMVWLNDRFPPRAPEAPLVIAP